MICYLDSNALVKFYVAEPAGLLRFPRDLRSLLDSWKS